MNATFESVIHRAVARHAAQRPDATAIITAGRHVSYASLDAAADAYAADLAERGVGPDTVVPLLLPRSAQLIALELGILKCGAAYAGLDLRWPADRIAAIIDLLSPPLVVTAEGASHDLGTHPVCPVADEDVTDAAARTALSRPARLTPRPRRPCSSRPARRGGRRSWSPRTRR